MKLIRINTRREKQDSMKLNRMFPPQLGIILLAIATTKSLGLRINSIEVPPAVLNSSQVTLVCNYDLQGDQLYSVKWYKNYVEFFRFQPNDVSSSGSSAPASSAQSRPTPASADNQPHSKHEFELDGIHLNMSKSNGTHVYLQQVNLASEGTYKCEVSAEPSFATISMERQMKVYILPRQKLSIVDNSASFQTTGAGATTTNLRNPTELQATMKQNLVYNINDFVNLTCISSHSRPLAKLTWLIDDMPVSASSKWLQQTSDTKLTLAFRLQPSHLLKGSGIVDPVTRYQNLKVRCVAKLSVEFSSESSIIVSGGKTTIKRRQELSHLPAPSSLNMQSGPAIAETSNVGSSPVTQVSSTEYPIYRWPRPLLVAPNNSGRPHNSGRTRNSSHEFSTDPWTTSSASKTPNGSGLAELQDGLSTASDYYDSPVRMGSGGRSSMSTRHLVVWTNRQLRDQAEHIDSVMRLARPNELDTPLIEGKIQLEEPIDDNPTENWNEPDETNRPAPDEETRAKPTILPSVNQDYELDDLVQFNCKPRVGFAESNSLKSVTSKWFINNKEISFHLVNAFDGNKFYYARNQYNTRHFEASSSIRPQSLAQNQNPSSTERIDSQYTNTDSSEIPTATIIPANGSQQQQANSTNESSLLVEFTSSLFQLKELNLKCRTIVEQPLIQYDSQVIISVFTNQFVQADNRAKTGGAFFRNTNSRQNGRIYSNQRSRTSNGRSSSSLSARSLIGNNWAYYLLFSLANFFILAKYCTLNLHL